MNWNRLREKIVNKTYPKDKDLEELQEKYSDISDYIQQEFGVETHFAGSASRQTCMKNDRDIDIFLLFPEQTDRKELENQGLKIGKNVFEYFNEEYEVDYAEHPYTKGTIDGFEMEIVPCYRTDPDNIKSSVDRTPHHSKWVKSNLSKEQKKDVVILKKFLNSNGLYGSSLKLRGFSGYLCEILVNHYGGFQELVKAAVNWREREILDPENHHEKLPEKLDKKFRDDNLVVIDPVDPERNVASVLSTENFAKFIFLCWNFNQRPGMKFFSKDEAEYSEFQITQELKKRAEILVLDFESPDEVDDIIYPQMRKTLRRLSSELEGNDFRVFEKGFHIGRSAKIFFELETKLPEVKMQKGPKLFHGEDHISEFNSKYSNVKVEDDRLVAKTDREYTDAKKFLKQFLDGKLEEKGVPENIASKLENYTFSDPVDRDQEWLNYLGEKLDIKKEGE